MAGEEHDSLLGAPRSQKGVTDLDTSFAPDTQHHVPSGVVIRGDKPGAVRCVSKSTALRRIAPVQSEVLG